MTALPSTILGLRKKDYQNVSIIVLDPDSGNDLEKPPHGWPSGLCLRNLWTQLLIFFNEAKSLNVHIQSLMLGQGLVGRKALVDKFFAKNGISVFLRESISTNASESGNLTIPIENDTQLNILVRQVTFTFLYFTYYFIVFIDFDIRATLYRLRDGWPSHGPSMKQLWRVLKPSYLRNLAWAKTT